MKERLRFRLGRLVMTRGAIELGRLANPPDLGVLVIRHLRGDWGCIPPEDAKANNAAILGGARILSAYPIDPTLPCAGDNTVWILTEADRSVTTILLPSEY